MSIKKDSFTCKEVINTSKKTRIDISMVTPLIFIGNQAAADNIGTLQALQIERLLRLRTEPSIVRPSCIKSVTLVKIEDIPTSDLRDCMEPCFVALLNAMEKKERVLVHCHAGKSRSPAIVIAFLMWRYGITLRNAYVHVEKARNGLIMNPTFKQQLFEYEQTLFGKNSVRYSEFCFDYI